MPDESLWFRLVVAVLGTWRVVHLVSGEDGPFDIIARLRARAGNGVWGKLLDCPYCLSLWVAAPLGAYVVRRPLDWVLAWLAISGATCLLERAGHDRYAPYEGGGNSDVMLWRLPSSRPPSGDPRVDDRSSSAGASPAGRPGGRT